ncbi:MAG: glutathione S-transferase N-terminal domain-containing protein [Leptospiraceae bacterium]|nr:glutathione S-transferase N-terminal domain-containing protein [Leptospiraceae bacterium]
MIKLFQFDSCPYCARVINRLKSLGLKENKDYKLIEASRGTPGREEVLKLGGMNQVPFLVDDEVQMYESADIIDYIEKKFA